MDEQQEVITSKPKKSMIPIIIIISIVAIVLMAASVIGVIVWMNMNTPEYKVVKAVQNFTKDFSSQNNILVDSNTVNAMLSEYYSNGNEVEISMNLSGNILGNVTLGIDSLAIADPVQKQMSISNRFSFMNYKLIGLDFFLDNDTFYVQSEEAYDKSLSATMEQLAQEMGISLDEFEEQLQLWEQDSIDWNQSLDQTIDVLNHFQIIDSEIEKEWETIDATVQTQEYILQFNEPYIEEETQITIEEIRIYLDNKNKMHACVIPVSGKNYEGETETLEIVIQFVGENNLTDQIWADVAYEEYEVSIVYNSTIVDMMQTYTLDIEKYYLGDLNYEVNIELVLDATLNEFDFIADITDDTDIARFESQGNISVDEETHTLEVEVYEARLESAGDYLSVKGSYRMSEKGDDIQIPEESVEFFNITAEEQEMVAEEIIANLWTLVGTLDLSALY